MLAGGAAAVEAIGIRIGQISKTVFIGGGGAGLRFWRDVAAKDGVTLAFTAIAGLALAAAVFYTSRGGLKSPWHRRRRKHILSPEQWRNLFTPDGRLRDNGIKFLKKVRTGGVDPSIRPDVWPFLLGVFDLTSSKHERDVLTTLKRKEYGELRQQCSQIVKDNSQILGLNESGPKSSDGRSPSEGTDSPDSECVQGAREFVSEEDPAISIRDKCSDSKQDSSVVSDSDSSDSDLSEDPETSQTFDITESTEDNDHVSQCKQISPTSKMEVQSESCKSDVSAESAVDENGLQVKQDSPTPKVEVQPESCNKEISAESTIDEDHCFQLKQYPPTSKVEAEPESCNRGDSGDCVVDKDRGSQSKQDSPTSKIHREDSASQTFDTEEHTEDNDHGLQANQDSLTSKMEVQSISQQSEDFVTWQRIIRLDAVRANGEWMEYNPAQASVSDAEACHAAKVVGLTGYEHLDSARIFHASRLVSILEAYALYDPEIGYCQGMSDLLSPIIAVMTEDHEAFWCFVGFMKKARHNFRLDEVGIRRQLNLVSKIIKYKDSHLYRHLERMEAEDCFFVYRMVVVLFRRELTFEQTLCLWEVMWADQAALRAGVGKSAWDRIRQRAPPTEDLLLYAIAASVLQRRKQIIEKYSSMDEILRECNAMAGHLDVWKLLDDAHGLVVMLNDKIETPL